MVFNLVCHKCEFTWEHPIEKYIEWGLSGSNPLQPTCEMCGSNEIAPKGSELLKEKYPEFGDFIIYVGTAVNSMSGGLTKEKYDILDEMFDFMVKHKHFVRFCGPRFCDIVVKKLIVVREM
jgi:hypothetical protein